MNNFLFFNEATDSLIEDDSPSAISQLYKTASARNMLSNIIPDIEEDNTVTDLNEILGGVSFDAVGDEWFSFS